MIFVSTTSLENHSDAIETVQRLVDNGIFNIELGADHEYFEDTNKIIEMKKEFGLNYTLHTFFPPAKDKFMLNIGSGNEKILKRSLEIIKNSMDFCRKADAKLYSIHSGYKGEIDGSGQMLSKPIKFERFMETVKQSAAEISDYGKDYGFKIALENQPPENEASPFTKPSKILDMIKELNLKNLGLLIDIGHLKFAAAKEGFDKNKEIEKVKDYILGMHVHDNDETHDMHNLLTNPMGLDHIPKDILKNKAVILEGFGNWSIEDIKKGISVIENLS